MRMIIVIPRKNIFLKIIVEWNTTIYIAVQLKEVMTLIFNKVITKHNADDSYNHIPHNFYSISRISYFGPYYTFLISDFYEILAYSCIVWDHVKFKKIT